MSEKCLTKKQILEKLSELAVNENVTESYRIKALELLGKANKMFGEDKKDIIGTVRIVDDVP